jgi:prepilin-type N-terminal cleavage/methylation domain-containing protein
MTTAAAPSRARRLRSAFTLVEVLVVMIIIAILATLTVPRLIGTQGRAAEVEALSVKSLLSQAAQQDAVTSGSLSLNFNQEKQELSVEALTEKEGKRDWYPVPMIRPIRFASIIIADATSDGQTQTPSTDFRVVFAGAKPRPAVSLLLRTIPEMPGPPRAWQVDLLPGQTVATFRAIGPAAPLAPSQGTAIDLDANGQRNQSW